MKMEIRIVFFFIGKLESLTDHANSCSCGILNVGQKIWDPIVVGTRMTISWGVVCKVVVEFVALPGHPYS